VYYEQWEQEYGDLGGPPFPGPTPYVVVGTTFSMGQRVRVPPLFVQVSIRTLPMDATTQWYLVDFIWNNPLDTPVAIDYPAQVRLRSITTPDGRLESSEVWGFDYTAAQQMAAASAALPTTVPPGQSSVTVPILAPPGEAHTVALTFRRDRTYVPNDETPTASTGAPYPIATPTATIIPTPALSPTTGNGDLRATERTEVVVQFVNVAPSGPPCDDPGAMTEWDASDDQLNGVPDAALSAPPGANRVVQIALQQQGKRYVWGAVGPESFDCSGLMIWAYAQVGIRIPYRTTKEQFAHMRSVPMSQAQPGDLVYWSGSRGSHVVVHVGMLVGDVTGDGRVDLVHAVSPNLGIRVESDIVNHPFYGNPATCRMCILGVRTVR
jgi:cell wall-associated NlpC family hydrolase